MKRPPVVRKLCVLPVDLHEWLKERAATTLSPTNAAIVTVLRAAMNAEQRTQHVNERNDEP